MKRFPLRFDTWFAVLSTAMLLPPSAAYVGVEAGEVTVRMGWGFRSRFPTSAVARTSSLARRPMSRGAAANHDIPDISSCRCNMREFAERFVIRSCA